MACLDSPRGVSVNFTGKVTSGWNGPEALFNHGRSIMVSKNESDIRVSLDYCQRNGFEDHAREFDLALTAIEELSNAKSNCLLIR